MWEWARSCLVAAGIEEVVVVGDVPGGVPGGDRRRDSVLCGLDAVRASAEFVVVHDAARPLADSALVRAVIDRLTEGDVDAVIPAVGVRDTLKFTDGERVVHTVSRSGVVAVQTPQGFVLSSLRRAHLESVTDATDDAELIERIGGTVVMVAGDERNLKITYPGDLAVAERMLP